jgi:hypothetical protein
MLLLLLLVFDLRSIVESDVGSHLAMLMFRIERRTLVHDWELLIVCFPVMSCAAEASWLCFLSILDALLVRFVRWTFTMTCDMLIRVTVDTVRFARERLTCGWLQSQAFSLTVLFLALDTTRLEAAVAG